MHLVDDEQVDGDELVDDVGLVLLGATGRRAERAAHGPRQVKPLHVPARPARLARAVDDTDAKLDEIAVVEPVEEQVAGLRATSRFGPCLRDQDSACGAADSRALAERTRDGLLKRFEQGALIGGVAPYGYQVVDRDGRRVLAVNPDEAAVVREVAHGYLCEAVSFKAIAKGLRARQVASRRGAGWSFTSVRSLLMNPILTGWTRYNVHKMHLNRSTGRRVHRAKAEAQHLRRHDESLRILDDATFARIEERMDSGSRGEKPQATRGIGPFTSLVYCTCGAK